MLARTNTHAYLTNPQSHAEKHTNYETTEAEAENWALLRQAGGGDMTQHESGTNCWKEYVLACRPVKTGLEGLPPSLYCSALAFMRR